MMDVPLFPLNTVLFPQMVLPLYVFEQRYRLMISECLKNNTPFGVVLIQEGDEVQEQEVARHAPSPTRPCAVGTLARITEVAKLEDGRMLLTTVGTDRFRLMEFHSKKPYLTGDIEIWPDESLEESQHVSPLEEVRLTFQNYLKVLMELAGKQIQGLEIPEEPGVLSYLIPNWLHISTQDKQKLLEIPGPQKRLQMELNILLHETTFFEKLKEQATEVNNLGDFVAKQEEVTSSVNGTDYNLAARFSRN
jgi:Lon protease-like protein